MRDTRISERSFAVGIIEAQAQRVGVLRIDAFGSDRYASMCEMAWRDAAAADSSGRCGSACERRLFYATSDSLLAEMRRSIARLRTNGATIVAVDLTGNGGGDDWVTAAARQFTAKRLAGHIDGTIRHPHHEPPLLRALAAMRAGRTATRDPGWKGTLDTAIARAESQLLAVRTPCDRRRIWREGLAAISCTQLATEKFTTGFLEYLPPSARSLPAAGAAFGPARFAYEEGTWDGTLVLVVDHRTASASEDFVVALKDHGAARVVGERTYGAGCGYTYGGIGFVLPNSGLEVAMPDCARIRRNGRNEVSGIEVDLQVKIKADDVLAAVLDR